MSKELILRTENICKSFNGIQVLKNVNLEIEKGEIHALMAKMARASPRSLKSSPGYIQKTTGRFISTDSM